MFTVTLLEFKIRRAAKFRLMKLLKKPGPWTAQVFTAVGRLLIESGTGIINRYQIAQYKY